VRKPVGELSGEQSSREVSCYPACIHVVCTGADRGISDNDTVWAWQAETDLYGTTSSGSSQRFPRWIHQARRTVSACCRTGSCSPVTLPTTLLNFWGSLDRMLKIFTRICHRQRH